MKKIIFTFIFCVLTSIVIGQNPNRIFKSHLKIIENFLSLKNGESMTSDKFMPSVLFLEDLTGIKCDMQQGFVMVKEPSQKNLNDWKSWYAENKNRLYWNKTKEKVKIKRPHN